MVTYKYVCLFFFNRLYWVYSYIVGRHAGFCCNSLGMRDARCCVFVFLYHKYWRIHIARKWVAVYVWVSVCKYTCAGQHTKTNFKLLSQCPFKRSRKCANSLTKPPYSKCRVKKPTQYSHIYGDTHHTNDAACSKSILWEPKPNSEYEHRVHCMCGSRSPDKRIHATSSDLAQNSYLLNARAA